LATNNVELRPFTVPNFVIQVTPARAHEEGFREAPKYALAELDAWTLAELCDGECGSSAT
jgi:hypothetical protein